MLNLFFGTLYVLFISAMLFLPKAQAAGTSYYVAPNGGGSACTSSSPCSLNTALSKAGPGDEVVLKSGTYNQFVETKRSGTAGNLIIIRGENQHGAIIKPSNPGHRKAVLTINHSHIVFRGIVLDGSKKVHLGVRISPATREVQNIVFENNVVRDSGSVGFSIRTSRNVIIRHNLIDSTGWFSSHACCGEGFYIGTPHGSYKISNLEIYGNVLKDTTANAFDVKGPTEALDNISIHHNIIENHTWMKNHNSKADSWNDGLFILYGTNVNVSNNIVRDSDTGSSLFRIAGNANNTVLNNVLMNSKNGSVVRTGEVASRKASEVAFNTYCNMKSYKNHSDGTTGVNIHDNTFNVPSLRCDVEVQRILNEMKNLPRASGDIAQSTQPLPPARLKIVHER